MILQIEADVNRLRPPGLLRPPARLATTLQQPETKLARFFGRSAQIKSGRRQSLVGVIFSHRQYATRLSPSGHLMATILQSSRQAASWWPLESLACASGWSRSGFPRNCRQPGKWLQLTCRPEIQWLHP